MSSLPRFTFLLRNSLRSAFWLTLGLHCLPAQVPSSGTLEGRVLHATSGNYLGQARVVVQGMLLEAATASSRIVTLDAFTVQDRELSAQGAALNEQRNAANIKNVVSIEEFGDLGITNPGHFLSYIPGVSNVYNTTGEVEGIGLRGMGSSGTVVMFDGAAAASNEPASRVYNFSGTSVANLDRVEVTRVPPPDLPANATTPTGTYTGLAPRTLLGGSLEYRLNKRIKVHFSGQNLSNALYRNMTFSPGAPAYVRPTQYRDNGIEYVLGLKGEY